MYCQSRIVNQADIRYHVDMENASYKTTEAHRRANLKYDRSLDRILLRLPKGKKAELVEHLKSTPDDSLNAFIRRAIDETMERDK